MVGVVSWCGQRVSEVRSSKDPGAEAGFAKMAFGRG